MVQVEPIVVNELALHDLRVIHDIVGNLRVGQHQGHGIVPGQLAFRAVDRHPWRDLQLDPLLVHLGIRDALQHPLYLHVCHGFEIDPANGAFP